MKKPQGMEITSGYLPLLSDNPKSQRIGLLCEATYISFLLIKISLVYIKKDLLGEKK